MICTHNPDRKQLICGTLVCGACYYDMIMHPTWQEVRQFEKQLYRRVIYVYDASSHKPIPQVVYPGDPLYETGSRTTEGVDT